VYDDVRRADVRRDADDADDERIARVSTQLARDESARVFGRIRRR
jgi:hypothetical protein